MGGANHMARDHPPGTGLPLVLGVGHVLPAQVAGSMETQAGSLGLALATGPGQSGDTVGKGVHGELGGQAQRLSAGQGQVSWAE